ncbi:hypothetical protein PACTADRAFT_47041 [Pachysolen tannophilus NRRL Y-2460]|uniref:Threonyl/alanyl tRNA synthetase SAD domain-containing protein n=1 Tax=Pachysolen tannophilus NRRL Y-2460 TaxID=669874 RepID=A0A1E4TNV6_PACTA|nr:hypothetical protein PACTADRAFT_47041 [Pachysolen tannophilus NRRL Y-2460]
MTVTSKYSSTIVGALACQRESYLKKLTTRVVNCNEQIYRDESSSLPRYQIELEDTILFPLGGGQPSDQGYISYNDKKIPVLSVIRDGLIARHITPEPIQVGTEVELSLDWKRRFDHMQQHTGQHLLSAILDRYELPTLSWAMGEMINYVEIPRKLTEEEIEKINEEVNDAIYANIEVNVEVPHKDQVDKSKMPEDYDLEKGILRVVHIGNLDSNPCCGTHLSSTLQINSICLLHQASVRGTNSRLFFLAGDRVRKYAKYSHNILKNLNSTLSCQTDEILDKVSLLSNNLQKTSKRETNWIKEIVNYKVEDLKKNFEKNDFDYLYRPDVGLEFINQIFKDINQFLKENPSKNLVLLSGEGKTGGSLIIMGNKTDEIASSMKKLIKNLKGGGKGKFQGKITSFEKNETENIKKYLDSLKEAETLTLENLTI